MKRGLEFFEELAGRTGDVDATRDAALAVLHTLDDAGGLGALGAIGALVGIHDLLAVAGLGNLRHNAFSSMRNCAAEPRNLWAGALGPLCQRGVPCIATTLEAMERSCD